MTTPCPRSEANRDKLKGHTVEFVRNKARGAHSAVMTGFAHSTTPAILMYPADDDYNAGMLDRMVEKAEQGCDIVCASRFMPGGSMIGCPVAQSRAGAQREFHLASHRTHPDA